VIWIGFNLAMFPGAALAQRFGTLPVVAAAAGLGAIGEFIAAQAPSIEVLVGAQLLAGGAWGCVLMAGYSAAVEFGRTGREGWALGLLFAALAAAALARMGAVLAGLDRAGELAAALAVAPSVLWCVACLLLIWLVHRNLHESPAA
jgi:MFS family permease